MTGNYTEDEFLSILEKNSPIIIKISRAYTQVKEDREDLINDITLELWKSFKHFKGNASISTWIYRVALNVSMNYSKKKKKEPLWGSVNGRLTDKDVFHWLFIEENDFSEQEVLYDCINELDEINKAIILLYLDGNSHEEISNIMGITKTNVGTRIARIKEQLKRLANTKK